MKPKITLSSRGVTLSFGAPSTPPVAAAVEVPPLPMAIKASPVEPVASGWAGHYHIETRGKSEPEIVAEVTRVQLHHEKKSARLDGFQSLIGSTFIVNGDTHTVAHVSIGERGTDVELYAAAVSSAGARTTVQSVYRTVDDVPTNQQIEQMLQNEIAEEHAAAAAETQKMGRLAALLGGE